MGYLKKIRDAKIQNSRYERQEILEKKCKWFLHCAECPNDWCKERTESDSTSGDLTGTP